MTVLKDAASIYGTKGTNGAIIITTSRAKQQATHIDFGAYTTYNQQPSSLPVIECRWLPGLPLWYVTKQGPVFVWDQCHAFYDRWYRGNPDYYRYHNNTNWQKKVFNNSLSNNYFLRVTGGDNILPPTPWAWVILKPKEPFAPRIWTGTIPASMPHSISLNVLRVRLTCPFTFNEQNLRDQGISDKTAPLFLALTKAPFMLDREVNDKGVTSPTLPIPTILGNNPAVLINNMQAF